MDDEQGFGDLLQRHRRELHVHCYRMLGSFEEAEDLVQETFLRAWRSRDSFAGDGFRAWLYRIATNACLDALRRNMRRVHAFGSFAEVPWIQPYPDRLLDQAAPVDAEPDSVVVARETIELGFLALIQLLPPRQRAVLVLRDVVGWSAAETADALDLSVPAANSALQRARTTLRKQSAGRRMEWSATEIDDEERELLRRFIDAHERMDAQAALAVAAEDIRVTMPPNPYCYDGREAIGTLLEHAFGADRPGDWRLVPTAANRQPAAASYVRRHGEAEFSAFKLDVLRLRDGAIAEITTFGAALFPEFGLPPVLERSS